MSVVIAVVMVLSGLDAGATATEPADRITIPIEVIVGDPPVPPPLDSCERMHRARIEVGLPAVFDRLGLRESGPRCDNNARSGNGRGTGHGCCVGWWQISRIHFTDGRMLAACGATWLNIRGRDPGAERRQACAAKVLYDEAGLRPWR